MSVEQAKPNPNGGKTGTTALESLHVAAEGTNGRNGLDELPKQKSVLNPTYVRLQDLAPPSSAW